MLRLSWWAAIILLIVESCANKPVASLEAAGSFVITLPDEVLRLHKFYRVVPLSTEESNSSRQMIAVCGLGSSWIWLYRIEFPLAQDSLCLDSTGAFKIDLVYYDRYEKSLYLTGHNDRRVYRLSRDLEILSVDTLGELRDNGGVEYFLGTGMSVGKDVLYFSVGANTDVDSFLIRPCLAAYDLKFKRWRFLHRHPIEIQKDAKRTFWYPLLASFDITTSTQYHRFQFSDSVYSTSSEGIVKPKVHSKPVGVDFHRPYPASTSSTWDLEVTEPRITFYEYLPKISAHVSVLVCGQSPRMPDGRLATDGTSEKMLIVSRHNKTTALPLPRNIRLYSPSPSVIGDQIMFARDSDSDRQAGRATFTTYRLRLN